MFRSIEKLASLGVFVKHEKPSDLPPFERYNVIYGMNGSGKTTLSRFFSFLNSGASQEFPDLKYTVTGHANTFKQGQPYPEPIRVFNTDYVQSTVGEIEGQLNPIFVIGKENKNLVAQLAQDESTLQALLSKKAEKNSLHERLVKERGQAFTSIARTIAEATAGQITRSYRKPDAERSFNTLVTPMVLSAADLEKRRKLLRQNCLENLRTVELAVVPAPQAAGNLSTIDIAAINIANRSLTISKERANSLALQRLCDKSDIADWIESGLELHSRHESNECEYCGQSIPRERTEKLRGHFDDADQDLKKRIQKLQEEASALIQACSPPQVPPDLAVYEELRDEYNSLVIKLNEEMLKHKHHAEGIASFLQRKLESRNEQIDSDSLTDSHANIVGALSNLNAIIAKHNDKSDNFQKRLKDARDAIEAHYLSTIKTQVDGIDIRIQNTKAELNRIEQGDPATKLVGIEDLQIRIRTNRSKVSNSGKAAEELSSHLATFLGRGDLQFEPEGDGYRINRKGKPAKKLSEGEKTAIAFIYFTVHLRDQDFNLQEGIVVVDDPVSSLDSNSTYQAFSFLKNSVKEAKQVFLMTHNFEFLKLLMNWVQNVPRSEGKKSYYMLLCSEDSASNRHTEIAPLDRQLLENKSEYAFLFKNLFNFRSDGTIAGSYHVPNMARKLLETFLDFYYPASESAYKKLQRVDFDEFKKTALQKFSNDLSHPTGKGFDPALVPETQKNVRYLMEMIEAVSPTHYDSMVRAIQE